MTCPIVAGRVMAPCIEQGPAEAGCCFKRNGRVASLWFIPLRQTVRVSGTFTNFCFKTDSTFGALHYSSAAYYFACVCFCGREISMAPTWPDIQWLVPVERKILTARFDILCCESFLCAFQVFSLPCLCLWKWNTAKQVRRVIYVSGQGI